MTRQPNLIDRQPKRMRQPSKATLRDKLREVTAEMIRGRERIAALQAARQHDHDTARKVPRILRQLFGA
jgi:hypothetical protein